MQPITNRLVTRDRKIRNSNNQEFYVEQYVGNRTVQRRPYNLPTKNVITKHVLRRGTDAKSPLNGGPNYYSINGLRKVLGGSSVYDPYRTYAYHKAYMDFIEDVRGDESQLLELFAEARKTAETISNRAVWLLSFTERLIGITKLPKKAARKALAILERRIPKSRRRRRRRRYIKLIKDPAALFIEYRWVYATAAADMYNAATFLDTFRPKVEGKGRSGRREYDVETNKSTGTYPTIEINSYEFRMVAKVNALVAVTNPNLFALRQMGVTNPIATGYNLVKFSWLVDWFSTFGDWLSSWDALLGLSITNPSNMRFEKIVTTRSKKEWYSARRSYNYYAMSGESIGVFRDTGLGPGPSVMLRPVGPISLTRGATAISLLIGYLRG